MKRQLVGGPTVALFLGLSLGCAAQADGPSDGQVPTFEVDALWPMPLEYPNILGPVSGVTVASDGNILIVTRQDGFSAVNEINSVTGTGTCCTPTPAVVEFAPDGSLVRAWGGPDQGYAWPNRPHGIAVDPDGNVWIGGGVAAAGRGGRGGRGGGTPQPPVIDGSIHKFSRTGEHLMTVEGSFSGAGGFSFDASAGEAFVADGYGDGHRVAVLDMATGAVKREWGGNGSAFSTVTCAEVSNDGLVYVCDRGNNRIQVFQTDGTFVQEVAIEAATMGSGSVADVAFSPDADQSFMYVADGMNERVYILERESLQVMTSFGVGGRYPGHFRELGSVAVDGAGNVYTAENGQGRRVQKFVHLGPGAVTAEHQGALYPGGAP